MTRIQKWGNSLGLRIPKAQAEEVGVEAGSQVDIKARDGEIVIRPVRHRQFQLASLLQEVTPENLHGEMAWGDSAGKEAL